jgi:hypothetical protein
MKVSVLGLLNCHVIVPFGTSVELESSVKANIFVELLLAIGIEEAL